MYLSSYEAETAYYQYINQAQAYMRHKQLPDDKQQRVIAFFDYRFKKSYFKEAAITETLSGSIDIKLKVFFFN